MPLQANRRLLSTSWPGLASWLVWLAWLLALGFNWLGSLAYRLKEVARSQRSQRGAEYPQNSALVLDEFRSDSKEVFIS